MGDKEETSPGKDTFLIGEEDVFSDLSGRKGSSLFLGKYSLNEVVAVLGKKNFLKEAHKRNFSPLQFDLDSSGYPLYRFQIFLAEKKPDNLIVDLKIREGTYTPKDSVFWPAVFSDKKYQIIEWLTLQNPLIGFSEKRPALPGQTHPGLSLGKKVLDIFIYLAKLTRKDGILAFPAYFHNALLFSRYFQFVNPDKQGEVLAIRKAFSSVAFKHMAWIVYLNCLKKDGQTYEWRAEEQVFPLNKTLKAYFDSKKYRERIKKTQKECASSFSIDWGCFEKKMGISLEKKI